MSTAASSRLCYTTNFVENEDSDDPANRRKPRVYASFQQPTKSNPYPLDFCIWLHDNYDALVQEYC